MCTSLRTFLLFWSQWIIVTDEMCHQLLCLLELRSVEPFIVVSCPDLKLFCSYFFHSSSLLLLCIFTLGTNISPFLNVLRRKILLLFLWRLNLSLSATDGLYVLKTKKKKEEEEEEKEEKKKKKKKRRRRRRRRRTRKRRRRRRRVMWWEAVHYYGRWGTENLVLRSFAGCVPSSFWQREAEET